MTPEARRTVWSWLLAAVPVALVLWARTADPFREAGVTNVFSFLMVAVAGAILFLWFTRWSGLPRALRRSVAVAVLVGIVASIAFFRIEGFSGSMIPTIGLRIGGTPDAPPPEVPVATVGIDLATTTPFDFPGFLGPGRDLRVEGVRLARDWEVEPPELVWRRPVGAGWSGFAARNGYAVTLEQWGEDEAVTAYSIETGELAWATTRPGHFGNFLGGEGPRSTPLIDGGRVYALGAVGWLSCLDGANGEIVWERDLLADYGVSPEAEAANVNHGRAASPLVVGDLLIVPAGGVEDARMAGLAAFDAATGEPAWESPPRQVSFASPSLATIAGVEQVTIVNEDTASGHDPATGRLLWEIPWPGVTSATGSASQVLALPPDRLMLSKGYGGGAAVFRLFPRDDGSLEPENVWQSRRVLRTKFTNAIVVGRHVYGLSDGILECVQLDNGRRVWRDGRYGHGQPLLVGELLLVLTEEGEVVLIDPKPDDPNRVLGRFQAIEGKTWNNVALYGDVLLVRNAEEAAAWRLPLADG